MAHLRLLLCRAAIGILAIVAYDKAYAEGGSSRFLKAAIFWYTGEENFQSTSDDKIMLSPKGEWAISQDNENPCLVRFASAREHPDVVIDFSKIHAWRGVSSLSAYVERVEYEGDPGMLCHEIHAQNGHTLQKCEDTFLRSENRSAMMGRGVQAMQYINREFCPYRGMQKPY